LPNNAAAQPVAEPQIEAPSEPSIKIPAIVDDATEAIAKYSIQEGVYSSSANAVAREELLREANLSAYSLEYLNSNDEPRYNVRFGYFASRGSAQEALDAFQQQFSANGFIVRFKR
jgi:cell division septation protein DedD